MISLLGSVMTIHKQLSDYYRGLCSGRGTIPARADVNPMYLKKILSWVLLLESEGPRHIVPSLVGSNINDAMGSNFTGMNMFDYYPAPVADIHEAFYRDITTTPCGGYIVRKVEKKNGIRGTLEALLFPLTGPDGGVNRFIGSMYLSNKEMIIPENEDRLNFTSMSIVEIRYEDIGFGVPASTPLEVK